MLKKTPQSELTTDTRKRMTEAPTKEEAMEAVRTLIAYAGDNPEREGLIDTPKRVAQAYKEFFKGYEVDPKAVLSRTFEDVEGYDDIVLLKNMRFESHCEHHMVPIIGQAHIAYLPNERVVGISKIGRVLEIYAKRLQTQETMTAQIANTMEEVLKPKGVAVIIDAFHQCMTTRGIHNPTTSTVTKTMTGVFKTDPHMEERIYQLIAQKLPFGA